MKKIKLAKTWNTLEVTGFGIALASGSSFQDTHHNSYIIPLVIGILVLGLGMFYTEEPVVQYAVELTDEQILAVAQHKPVVIDVKE